MTRKVMTIGVFAALAAMLMPFNAVAVAPDTDPFARTWERNDRAVTDTVAARTWLWGPAAFTSALYEPYAESAGGDRQVQYFDKSRMEITDPAGEQNSPWYVTNGLLVVELVTGRLQLGADTFEQHEPAEQNVAGDPDDTQGPTYRTFGELLNATPLADGAAITQRVDRDGNVSNDASLADYGATAAHRVTVPNIDHQVASPFWAFLNANGTVWEDGGYIEDALFENPFYATGYPITEAYWATVKVAGTPQDVLVQCFERRCLTWTPGNPDGWKVEAGNVGRHYFDWRYPASEGSNAYAFMAAWGQPGEPDRPGQQLSIMKSPCGIALGPSGAIYVADSLNHEIKKFDRDGNYLASWGGLGSGPDQLHEPYGIATDEDEIVYVADSWNHRIVKYTSDGEMLGMFGSQGTGPGQLDLPFGIALDPDGNIYVADTRNNRVQKFTNDGQFLTQWGVTGRDPGEFTNPWGIVVSAGRVIVADFSNDRIQQFDLNGNFIQQWGERGESLGELKGPTGVTVDQWGYLYVSDGRNARVQKFTLDGELIAVIGAPGTDDGEFGEPHGLAVDPAGVLYVVDYQSHRTQKFMPT
jgi:DNA-binding beta-propeller fold protein YncE